MVNRLEGLPVELPRAPQEVQLDAVRPLMNDADPDIAALAAYFVVLLGDRSALPVLLSKWRALEPAAERDRLVYRAIASLDAAEHVPELTRIYRRIRQDPSNWEEIRKFYWTIRAMTGPEILRLRARIRQEVGMEILR